MQQTRETLPVDYTSIEVETKTTNATLQYSLDLLSVAVRLIVCLGALYMGLIIAVTSNNDGIALLAALGCWGVIQGLLGPKEV